MNAIVKITEIFPGLPKTPEVTYYNHIIDSNFTYIGVAAIIMGVILAYRKLRPPT